jgi:hypothetical protein
MIGRVQADFTHVGLGEGPLWRCFSTPAMCVYPTHNLASASADFGPYRDRWLLNKEVLLLRAAETKKISFCGASTSARNVVWL